MAIIVRITEGENEPREVEVQAGGSITVNPGDVIELVGVDRADVEFTLDGDDLTITLESGESITLVGLAAALEDDNPATVAFGDLAAGDIIAEIDGLIGLVAPAAGAGAVGVAQGGTFRADGDLEVDDLGGERTGAAGPGEGIDASGVDPFGLEPSFGDLEAGAAPGAEAVLPLPPLPTVSINDVTVLEPDRGAHTEVVDSSDFDSEDFAAEGWSTFGDPELSGSMAHLHTRDGGEGDGSLQEARAFGEFVGANDAGDVSQLIDALQGLDNGGVRNMDFDDAIKREVSVEAGDVMTFEYTFTHEQLQSGEGDFAVIIITDADGNVVHVEELADIGDLESDGGEGGVFSGTFEFEFTESGDFNVTIAVVDQIDSGFVSWLSVDDFEINRDIPASETVAVFTVTLSEPAGEGGVFISFTTVDGTAISGGSGVAENDYGAQSGVLFIPEGETTATIEVTIFGDEFVEGTEQYLVTLDADPGVIDLENSDLEGVGTIIDEDAVEFSLSGDSTVLEGGGQSEIVQNGTENGDGLASYTISMDGEALADGVSVNVDLKITFDGGIPGAESADFDYDAFVADLLADLQSQAEEVGGITVTLADVSLEDDGTGMVTFTVTFDSSAPESFTFDLSILADDLVEGKESYTVEILNAGGAPEGVNVSIDEDNDEVITTILDGDAAVFSLVGQKMVPEAGEKGGSVAKYRLSLTGDALADDVTASVDLKITLPGGVMFAEGPDFDYDDFVAELLASMQEQAPEGVTVEFESAVAGEGGAGMVTFTVTYDASAPDNFEFSLAIFDDDLVEGKEGYRVEIRNAQSNADMADITIDGDDNTVNTTILDDDAAVFSLSGDSFVAEGGEGGSSADYTLSLTGDPLAGDVTASVDLKFTLPGGVLGAEGPDFDYDAFVAELLASLQSQAPEGVTVQFKLAEPGEDPDTGMVTFTVTYDASAPDNFEFSLDILDDNLVEGKESYTVELLNADSNADMADITINEQADTVDTTITDNDAAVFSLIGQKMVDEDDEVALYRLSLTGDPLAEDVTASVDLKITLPGGVFGAEGPDFDYDAFVAELLASLQDQAPEGVTVAFKLAEPGEDPDTGMVTFTVTYDASAPDNFEFSLAIFDDNLVEGKESYTVEIINAQSNADMADITINEEVDTVDTTILDNDAAVFSLSGDSFVAEGGEGGSTADYTLSLTGDPLAGDVTASVDLKFTFDGGVPGAESADFDYDAFVADLLASLQSQAPEGVTVALADDSLEDDGTGMVTFTVTYDASAPDNFEFSLDILDDNLVEGKESYTVELLNADSNADMADITINEQADTVDTTITDNDAAVFSLIGQKMVPEAGEKGGSAAKYRLSLTGDPLADDVTASVDLKITLPGGVMFAEGPDFDYDDFVAELLASMQEQAPEGVTVEFESAVPGEGGSGMVTFTVTYDASAPDNFEFSLAIFDDNLVEGKESYRVEILNAKSNADMADITINEAVDSVDTTILDNDAAVFSLSGDSFVAEGGEGGSAADYTLSLTGDPLAGDVTASVDLKITLPGGVLGAEGPDFDYDVFVADLLTSLQSQAPDGVTVEFKLAEPGGDPDTGMVTFTVTYDATAPDNFEFSLDIFDDNLVEGKESFTVELVEGSVESNADMADITIDGDADSVDTTIVDNDAAVFSLVGEGFVIEGGEGAEAEATYFLSLTGDPLAEDVTASVDLKFTFPGGVPGAELPDFDYDDFVAELLASLQSQAPNGVTVALSDDSLEDDGTGMVTFTVTYDNSAPDNFEFSLDIFDDNLVEGRESYTVELVEDSVVSNADMADITINADANTVDTTILDDDAAVFSLSGDSFVAEGGEGGSSAEYTLSLTGDPLADDVTASVDLKFTFDGGVPGAELPDFDYDDFVAELLADLQSQAPAGVTVALSDDSLEDDGTGMVTFTVTYDNTAPDNFKFSLDIFDDDIIEGKESYTVSLANETSNADMADITIGNGEVITTIVDNDSAQFSLRGDSTVEEGNLASYTVTFTGNDLADDVTANVDLKFTLPGGEGFAESGDFEYDDFVAGLTTALELAIFGKGIGLGEPQVINMNGVLMVTFTLTFTAESAPGFTFDLAILDDDLPEGDEQYTVELLNAGSNADMADITIGTSEEITTILDNDSNEVSQIGLQLSTSRGAGQFVAVSITQTTGEGAEVVGAEALANATAQQEIALDFVGGESIVLDPEESYTIAVEYVTGGNTFNVTGLVLLTEAGDTVLTINAFAPPSDDFDVAMGQTGNNYDGALYFLDPTAEEGDFAWDISLPIGYDFDTVMLPIIGDVEILQLDSAWSNTADFTVDLGDLDIARFAGIEGIDITGNFEGGNSANEDNTLIISADDVVDITGAGNLLVVFGESGETVDLVDQDGAGGDAWVMSGVSPPGFDTWVYGSIAIVVIDEDINVTNNLIA